MTEPLPEPPVPADADLRGMPFMPLYIERLQKSKAWLRCKRTPALAFYLMNLWMRAWHETPAASIEDDDDVLADAAMCPPADWPALRADVLRGWIKASDGRLYNPTVAEVAAASWEERKRYRARTEAARKAREQKRDIADTGNVAAANAQPKPSATDKPATVTRSVTASKGKGERQGEGEGEGQGQGYYSSDPSDRTGSAAPPPSPGEGARTGLPLENPNADFAPIPLSLVQPEGGDWSKALFRQGLDWLARSTGKPPNALRGLVGNWLRSAQQDHRAVFEKLAECEKLGIAEPVAWLTKSFAAIAGTSGAQAAVANEAELRRRMEAAQAGA